MAAVTRIETATTTSSASDAFAWAGGRDAWWDGVQSGFSALLTEAAHPAAATHRAA